MDRCNAMVLTWVMNVISQDVYMGLVYSDNAATVWKELNETYDRVDGSVVYNLLQKINYVKQGGSSVADYYHRLNSLWREFDALNKLPNHLRPAQQPRHHTFISTSPSSIRTPSPTRHHLHLHYYCRTSTPPFRPPPAIPSPARNHQHHYATTIIFAATPPTSPKQQGCVGFYESTKGGGWFCVLRPTGAFGYVVNNPHRPVRSSLLTRDPLTEVKDAYNLVYMKESHKGVPESSGVTESKQNATSLLLKLLTIIGDSLTIVIIISPEDLQFPQTLNDDGKDYLVEDGSSPNFDGYDSTQGRSDRQSKPLVRLNDYVLGSNVKYVIEKYVSYFKLNNVNLCFATSLNKSIEPSCLSEAIKPIGSKWIWKIKYKVSGEIEIYKARLVAKGFSPKGGFDYDETFSPVVKMITVRCLIGIVVVNNWPLYQLDVNNTFLYGDLVEDVYMTLSDGYNNKDKSKVCKLNKSLYGLKQTPRQWNAKLTTTLAEHGFEQSKFDYSLYTKHRGDKFISLLVYVDDIVITINDDVGTNEFKLFLSIKFSIKDLCIFKYFLGIEIVKNDLGLYISQRKYCLELLHGYGLMTVRPVNIPLPENTVLSFDETKDDKYLFDCTTYQKLVGN
uniref:Ribonuclease H-like domain-containing protein n=1 Tax=Tanacetum cinerariifolium TaxID=118510 RepID=A0A6L2MIY2_TANCI|nr:ribonuclease H-like domain-containing protein [Tanacetum cinerariifolium]